MYVKGGDSDLAASYRDSREVMYYQMPVLESVPKLIRGMVVKSIKSSVPESEQPHFADASPMRRRGRTMARYTNADDAYVLVVDGEGRVRWQTSGQVDGCRICGVEAAGEALRVRWPGAELRVRRESR